jgi:F-type H+-transporting ATPase subunit epsilon
MAATDHNAVSAGAKAVAENLVQVRLVTPDRILLDTTASAVELPAANGYMEVLPGHAPLLSELGAGDVVLHGGEAGEQRYFVAWGFVEVLPHRVTMLAEMAETPEQIDTAGAREELKRGAQMWQEAGDSPAAYEEANEVIFEAERKLLSAGSTAGAGEHTE